MDDCRCVGGGEIGERSIDKRDVCTILEASQSKEASMTKRVVDKVQRDTLIREAVTLLWEEGWTVKQIMLLFDRSKAWVTGKMLPRAK